MTTGKTESWLLEGDLESQLHLLLARAVMQERRAQLTKRLLMDYIEGGPDFWHDNPVPVLPMDVSCMNRDGKLDIGSLGSSSSKGDGPRSKLKKSAIVINDGRTGIGITPGPMGGSVTVNNHANRDPAKRTPHVAGDEVKVPRSQVKSLTQPKGMAASLRTQVKKEKKILKKVKKVDGSLATGPGFGQQTDAKKNAKLAALQMRYPSEVDAIVPPINYTNGFQPLRTARKTQYKATVPSILSTEAPSAYYYGAIFCASNWTGKFKIPATLSAGTNTYATYTSVDDPILSVASASTDLGQCGGMCVHMLNMTAMQNVGGTVIFGNIPANLVTASLSWNTLLSYRDTAVNSMVENPDLCFSWQPSSSDIAQFGPTDAFPATNTYNVLFCAWQTTALQTMTVCIDSIYGIQPKPAGQTLMGAVHWPQDDIEFQKALEIVMPPNLSPQAQTPAETESGFGAALKKLGIGFADAVVPGLGGLVEKGWDWVSSWFSSRKLHSLMVQLSLGIEPDSVKDAVRRGTMPAEYGALLLQLSTWSIRMKDPLIRYQRVDGTKFEYRPATMITDEFGVSSEVGAVTCCRPGDETSMEGLDFLSRVNPSDEKSDEDDGDDVCDDVCAVRGSDALDSDTPRSKKATLAFLRSRRQTTTPEVKAAQSKRSQSSGPPSS